MKEQGASRMSNEDRREQILAAASEVFGERGYTGGTTDAIAKAAGISQAYVVRMFGSKERLFAAVAERASGRVIAAFRGAMSPFTGAESHDERELALGTAYVNLLADRGILLTMLHLFSMGHDPALGPLARECLLESYRVIRDEAGMTPAEASAFFSRGMLITVLMAMRMPDAADDPDALEFMAHTFGPKARDIIELAHLQFPLEDAGLR
jgi:AcrR family transcriptional regulator